MVEEDEICLTPDCGNPHHARGYCKKCYSRLRRSGTLPKEGEAEPAAESNGKAKSKRSKKASKASKKSKAKGTDVLLPDGESADPIPLGKRGSPERLDLIKRRFERMQREIARIAESFETETAADDDD